MNDDDLPKPGSFLSTQQISELQIKLGMSVENILRFIETAQNKINATKQEVANRWKQTAHLDPADRRRLARE